MQGFWIFCLHGVLLKTSVPEMFFLNLPGPAATSAFMKLSRLLPLSTGFDFNLHMPAASSAFIKLSRLLQLSKGVCPQSQSTVVVEPSSSTCRYFSGQIEYPGST